MNKRAQIAGTKDLKSVRDGKAVPRVWPNLPQAVTRQLARTFARIVRQRLAQDERARSSRHAEQSQ